MWTYIIIEKWKWKWKPTQNKLVKCVWSQTHCFLNYKKNIKNIKNINCTHTRTHTHTHTYIQVLNTDLLSICAKSGLSVAAVEVQDIKPAEAGAAISLEPSTGSPAKVGFIFILRLRSSLGFFGWAWSRDI